MAKLELDEYPVGVPEMVTPKPPARTGRRFLGLTEPQQAALAKLGKQFGTDEDVMLAFLRAALSPEKIEKLVQDHLMSGGKGGGV